MCARMHVRTHACAHAHTRARVLTGGLACCRHGPSECECLDTVYVRRTAAGGRGGTNSTASADGKVASAEGKVVLAEGSAAECMTTDAAGGVTFAACDLGVFDAAYLWHQVERYVQHGACNIAGMLHVCCMLWRCVSSCKHAARCMWHATPLVA